MIDDTLQGLLPDSCMTHPKTIWTLSPVKSNPNSHRTRPKPSNWQVGWVQTIVDDGPIDISICIPNWNCKEYLRICLESLQDIPQGVRVETIVVDNASSDGSPEMIAREFPEVTLIRNSENQGFAIASNQAASLARGKYLLFLNNDTVVPEGTLRKLFDFAEAHPKIGMFGPKLVDPNGNQQISYRQKPTIAALLHRTMLFRWTGLLRKSYYAYRRNGFEPKSIKRVEVLMGAAVLIRRDIFDANGRWDEDFSFGGEDIELSIRVGKNHDLLYVPNIEIIHYGRISSRQNISYAAANVAIGYVHFFRKAGYSHRAVRLYKVAVTLDAPIQLVSKLMQFGWRRIRGRRKKAAKSWLVVKGLWNFLSKEMGRFWRA
jgi:N-acetylglucosaminyl-diphospho-decaprenol L-rhamnosyltransferase